jgi:hypothetical protein
MRISRRTFSVPSSIPSGVLVLARPRRLRGLLASVAVCLAGLMCLGTTVLAAPITVNLRVEGSTSTLFEGPVSTEGIPNPPGIATGSSPTAEPCDFKDNGSNGGFGTSLATPTAALYDAAMADHLAFNAEWFTSLHDFDISQVGGDIANAGGNEEYWGFAVDYTYSSVGGCQLQLAPGSEVLWAYNYFNMKHLLNLSGPASVTIGTPFTVHVTDGQTGEPISGAVVGQLVGGVTSVAASSPTTDAAGNATITLTQSGTVTLKATQSESVRSNGLAVSVVANGTCACAYTGPVTPSSPPPPLVADVAKIAGVSNGHVYSRRSAPRVLRGVVDVPAGGTLRQVRIRLERRYHGRCFDFSGSRESFLRTKKCGSAAFFSVGGSESFSYLLPAGLPKGHYVYDIEGINNSGQPTKLVSGVSHVVFQVK